MRRNAIHLSISITGAGRATDIDQTTLCAPSIADTVSITNVFALDSNEHSENFEIVKAG
jgi:hypothetical protein